MAEENKFIGVQNNVDLGEDVLGLQRAAPALVAAISSGCQQAWDLLTRKKRARDDIDIVQMRLAAIEKLKTGGHGVEIAGMLANQLIDDLKRQANKEAIAIAAVQHRSSNPGDDGDGLDTDWLNRFWRLAEDVSQEDAQQFWGMMLSRAAGVSGKVSKRLLSVLADIDGWEARELQRIFGSVLVYEVPHGQRRGVILDSFARKIVAVSGGGEFDSLSEELSMHVRPTHQERFGPAGIYEQSGWAEPAYPTWNGTSVDIELGGTGIRLSGNFSGSIQSFPSGLCQLELASGTALSSIGLELYDLAKSACDEKTLDILTSACEAMGGQLEKA